MDRDAYLLALCRYDERNPVAAGMVATVGQWPWSSHRAHAGETVTPPWLDSDGLHGYLLGRSVVDGRDRERAARRYAALVAVTQANEAPLWQSALRQQVFLGDEEFVTRMQALAAPQPRSAIEVPRMQRKSPCTLQDCLKREADQGAALRMACCECRITMTALAKELGLSVLRVSRLVAAAERIAVEKGKT